MNKCKTRASTSAEYTRRINKALEFIEQHLDQNIRLEDVARASHFSPYHFHRIFHALVGETVNDYVSRKRMEKAASRLMRKPALSVTDVAEAGGFSSGANFSKAFKLYFGVSPSELRNWQPGSDQQNSDNNDNSKTGKLYSKYGKAFNPKQLYSQFVTQDIVFNPNKLEEMLMKVKVEEQKEKPIAFLTSPNGYELDSVYATWDKVVQWGHSKGIDEKRQTKLAVCHDNPMITPEDKCRYDAAIVIDPDVNVTSPFTRSVIPGGKYAIAYFKDNADKINNFMTELCSNWFCNSGYEPDDYPPIFNYLNDSKRDGYVEMDVYIKLKELSVN